MNKRAALRFEKVFPVILSTEEFGECNAMARNISAGGILIEISEPMPLGTEVRGALALRRRLRGRPCGGACAHFLPMVAS